MAVLSSDKIALFENDMYYENVAGVIRDSLKIVRVLDLLDTIEDRDTTIASLRERIKELEGK